MAKQIQTGAFDVPEYEPKRTGRYRVRIAPKYLRRLGLEKQRTKKPMIRLVADALDEYFGYG